MFFDTAINITQDAAIVATREERLPAAIPVNILNPETAKRMSLENILL